MITKRFFGKTKDNEEVMCFKIQNKIGAYVEIISYGGTIISLCVPDKENKLVDVVLGFDTVKGYEEHPAYMGALIGRVANRTANGKFSINGLEYNLFVNDGVNHLHGGKKGFDKVVWNYTIEEDKLVLSYYSKDLEEYYPGNLFVIVTYSFNDNSELLIEYKAISDKDTPVNLTNHAYFNLAGCSSGSILNHKLKLHASKYTEVDDTCIPTGVTSSVTETPLDFTDFKYIKEGINEVQTQNVIGYDHNFVLDKYLKDECNIAAEVYEESTGIKMTTYTTKPGIQFYSGNYLDGSFAGKEGHIYNRNEGFCLETQYFPNSVNCDKFSNGLLKAGELYNHKTIYKFG